MRALPRRLVRHALLAGLLCWAAPSALGEVSVVHRGANSDVGTLIVSFSTISEDADPIPQADIRWQLFRSIPSTSALNLNGDVRNDGSPDMVFHRVTRRPVVVWAYDNGPDHDIAFSEWTDDGWSTEEFLSFDADDDLDPRIFAGHADETYIVWWTAGNEPRVMLAKRSTGLAAWQPAVRVSPPGEFVSRPTVAVHDGVVRVAYERQADVEPTGSRELVILRREPGGEFVEEHVIDVPRADRLDPVLDAGFGRLWISWKQSNTQFSSAELANDAWSAPRFHEWTDPSWVGVEGMRLFIRRSLFLSPDVADVEN